MNPRILDPLEVRAGVVNLLAHRMEADDFNAEAAIRGLENRYGHDEGLSIWWEACDVFDRRHPEPPEPVWQ